MTAVTQCLKIETHFWPKKTTKFYSLSGQLDKLVDLVGTVAQTPELA